MEAQRQLRLLLAHTITVFPGSIIEEQYFRWGSSAQLQYSQVQSLGKSSILGGEAELNGSDPICWSSLLELALHLLLAHCTALGPDGVVISSPGLRLAHQDRAELGGSPPACG